MKKLNGLFTIAITSLLLSFASKSDVLPPQASLPSQIMLNDQLDKPLMRLSIGPFITTQGKVAVGQQDIKLNLDPASSISLTIAGQQLDPGNQITFSESFDADGLMTIPLYANDIGEAQYEIVIDELYSDRDLVPTLKVIDAAFSEGDTGSQLVDVAIRMDVPAGRAVSVDYLTQDDTAYSVAGTARSIAYDEFGNAFVSVVENVRGGSLALDGGFPKFYSGNWDPNGDQWAYLTNVVRWLTKEGRGNKVLLFGDKVVTGYAVKHNGTSDFRIGFDAWAQANGFNLTIKDSNNYGGYGNVTIPLDELNQYGVVIVMSSEWNFQNGALDDEGINAFSDYSKQGGGLMLITDHEGFQNTANQIANLFNIRFFGNVNRNPVSVAYLEQHYGEHEIWDGLSVLPAGASEGNVDISAVDVETIDYLGAGGTINFNEGETEKWIQIEILGDTVRELDENFQVVLSNPVNAKLSGESNGVITIQNND